MKEQWEELKETIMELRDSNGKCTQQEVCNFLISYMEILEKQVLYKHEAVPILDKIRAEVLNLSNNDNAPEKIWDVDVLEIIDKYKLKII